MARNKLPMKTFSPKIRDRFLDKEGTVFVVLKFIEVDTVALQSESRKVLSLVSRKNMATFYDPLDPIFYD